MTAAGAPETAGEVRRSALSGVLLVGLRGVLVRLVGLVVTIVLSRLLVPREFGLLAFGQTVVVFGSLLTDVGVAAALIRSREEPTRALLGSFFGFQLVATTAVAAAASLALWPFGTAGLVTALMMWSLVAGTFGTGATVVLERRLAYGPIAFADTAASVLYAVLAIALVGLGFGVYGVAVATVTRSICQSAVLLARSRIGLPRPRLSTRAVRGLVGFGAKFQAASIIDLAREQGINLLTLGIAGTTVLGYWTLAERILVIPFLIFESLWRVSYPAVARLNALGVDPGADVLRALRYGSIATGVVLVGPAASAPVLVPAVFGHAWASVADVIPAASLGLLVSGPLSAAAAGYLYAAGRPGRVLAAMGTTILAWFVVLPILLPRIGVRAHGICWLAACLAEAVVLAGGLRPLGLSRVGAALGPTVAAAGAVGVPGLLVAQRLEPSVPSALAVAIAVTIGFVVLRAILEPRLLVDARAGLGHAKRAGLPLPQRAAR